MGYVVLALAVLSTFAAWALPLWMTLSALGYALVASAGVAPWRRAVGLLGLAPLLGMAAMFIGIAAEVGSQDEYGDHPAPFLGIGTIVTAAVTVAALVELCPHSACAADRRGGGDEQRHVVNPESER